MLPNLYFADKEKNVVCHLRIKIEPFFSEIPSPLAGEGGDRGKEFRNITPTFILPHRGGGKTPLPSLLSQQ